MTLPEFLTEAEARRDQGDGEGMYAGNLTRGELDDLKEWMKSHGTAAAQG